MGLPLAALLMARSVNRLQWKRYMATAKVYTAFCKRVPLERRAHLADDASGARPTPRPSGPKAAKAQPARAAQGGTR